MSKFTWYVLKNKSGQKLKCPCCGDMFESLTFIYPGNTPKEQVERIADDFAMCHFCSWRDADLDTGRPEPVEILIDDTKEAL